ncbi:MAG: hypothetical protein V1823_03190 [Chloroflexota bacterium]
MPSVRAALSNLSGPMPCRRKLRLFWRNRLTKLLKNQRGCGHPGEPGG